MPHIARYTRFVALSKHFLWVLVAAMIGIVIWVAQYNTGEGGARIVFSSVPHTAEALQDVMIKPHYQGVDSHNQPFTVVAEQGVQVDKDTITMEKVRADLSRENGGWIILNAGKGHINTPTKQMELTGGVDLFNDGGYEFRSDHAHVDMKAGSAYGDSPVEGQGPAGTLTADSFNAIDHGRVITFNGSVRMKLYP